MDYKTASTTTEWKTPPRVCRCCLSEGCYKDISAEYYWMGEKELYSEMLKECFDITIAVKENTSSPRLICEVCITRLRDASNFKKQVVLSERRFAEHLQSGVSLSNVLSEVPIEQSLSDIKIESIKDEAVISDDDPPDGADDFDDDDDPDYDESDSLPLKFEALKKEAMSVDLAFGDEIPVLNNPEMTIRRVSKTKEKPTKKIKVSKKELTIKPVKASGSKTRSKEEKVKKEKVKAAKTAKKGGPIYEYIQKAISEKKRELKDYPLSHRPKTTAPRVYKSPVLKPLSIMRTPSHSSVLLSKNKMIQQNVITILKYSNAVPFRAGLSSLICVYCGDYIDDPRDLRTHSTSTHPAPNYSSAFFNLKKDRLMKVDLTELTCKICSERQLDLETLKTHLGDAHGHAIDRSISDGIMPFVLEKDNWSCYLCHHRFLSFRSLQSHMSEHFHNYVCESCGRGFMLENELQTHMRSHGIETARPKPPPKKKELAYVCIKCPQRFRTHDKRMKHMVEVHDHQPFAYKCMQCPMVFKRRSGRHVHMQQVHNCGNNFTCPHCPVMFVTKTRRDEHVAKHARDAQDRSHECTSCGKVYAQKKSLKEHVKLHERDIQAALVLNSLVPPSAPSGYPHVF